MDRELFDPPVIVKSADTLAELAGRINAEHQQAETALRAGLEHAKNAGELLLEAKQQCDHGRWLPWLKANVRFSERTAQAYMRVAKRWEELEAKAQGLADLTFEDGLKLLAAPQRLPIGEECEIPVASIRVGERTRKSLGDIDHLARSIRAVGLINPIVVTPDYLLAVGLRRLEAVKRLEWERVRVYVLDIDPVEAEYDENHFRKEYTISEKVACARAIEEAEAAANS